MRYLVKFVFLLVVSAVVLLIAMRIGWISMDSDLTPKLSEVAFFNEIFWAIIIAAIFSAIGWVISKLYVVFTCLTLGIGCLLFPVVMVLSGYAKLWAVAQIIPGVTYTTVWWQVLLLSFLVGLYIPEMGQQQSSSTTSAVTSSSS